MAAQVKSGKIGPLLAHALEALEVEKEEERMSLMARGEMADGGLPLAVSGRPIPAETGESWAGYRDRVRSALAPLEQRVRSLVDPEARLLIAANAIQVTARSEQIEFFARDNDVEWVELDPLREVVQMDGACDAIEMPAFSASHPGIDGRGVKVAVLDSGVDRHHPFLHVGSSQTTTDESADIPGSHGTHCAGSIASRDAVFRGVAPEVELIDVKVLRSNGTGRHTWIERGIDLALDAEAQVLSLSLGFNHRPTWAQNGHGWACTDGRCSLCTAVDNASRLDGRVVVVAAGNEHDIAEALRQNGYGSSFDTELCCPGQAREAITVGAVMKAQPHQSAGFTSHGPTADGRAKPDLCAPGVNIVSTVPAPRGIDGRPLKNPHRSRLFASKSGTSMATPIVAGAAALVIQMEEQTGNAWTPALIRNRLIAAVRTLGEPHNIVGAGLLRL